MKTKDLIASVAAHRQLAREADAPELKRHHMAKFTELSLQLANHQADAHDRKMRALDRKCAKIRARFNLGTVAA